MILPARRLPSISGQVLGDGVTEVNPRPVLSELHHRDRGRGKRFGERGEIEHGVDAHRLARGLDPPRRRTPCEEPPRRDARRRRPRRARRRARWPPRRPDRRRARTAPALAASAGITAGSRSREREGGARERRRGRGARRLRDWARRRARRAGPHGDPERDRERATARSTSNLRSARDPYSPPRSARGRGVSPEGALPDRARERARKPIDARDRERRGRRATSVPRRAWAG